MELEHSESIIFNYSNVFFGRYQNSDEKCHKMTINHTLIYLYGGELIVEENNKQTKIHRGQCIFIRKDNRILLTKRARGEEQFKAIFMHLTRDLLRDFFHKLNGNRLPQVTAKFKNSLVEMPYSLEVESLFQSLTPYFDASVTPSDQIMQLKKLEGIYCLLNIDEKFYSCLFDFSDPWKIDILNFMDENYMCDLTVEEIANYTGRSLTTFKRDFKKISSLSPRKWIIKKRLKIAHDKIRHEQLKASDVYLEVGFKSLSHFSIAFKNHFGYSPSKLNWTNQ